MRRMRKYCIEGVERHRLPNGLTILMREDHSIPVVTSMIWYRVGSRYEAPGSTGISHFLEHMMFKGTDRYEKGEIDYLTAVNGGNSNAFTSSDYTAYFFSFASDRWWQALEIESNRMQQNRFDPREFELEKQVIIEELKMDLDTPWGALRQAVEFNSFERHPYKYPVIGLYEDLVQISLEQMVDYYHRFYTPNNATLVVVGDFHPRETLGRIEDLFGTLPRGDTPPLEVVPEHPQSHQKRVEIRKRTRVPRMLLTFPAPSVRQADYYAVEVMDNILSEGKLSRLYQRLVEKERLASMVDTQFGQTFDPYLFFVRLELQEGADLERAEKAVFEEIDQLCQYPLSESELWRAKNHCITGFLSDLETTLGQAVQLGLLETLDRYEYWDTYAARVLELTPDQIREVAARYWPVEHATVGIVVDGNPQKTLLHTRHSG